ncbi:metallophosphoesterase [Paenarthrobacter sp. DKR-5]|uniref:metallophosphoesterase family protein n=1 Tax=Paenarthrobacter sp. DKR-5 TaxID=2835535 RepID=UPI001BDCB3CC|nr:metallophosphoesterase [Paenarthrobacter sp. DKR-5]MBT1000988.1 metallophosphoesterase [Paenarthrobacter sp. DKR-5]
MTTRLLILSDTHIPKRARALPAPVWEAVEAADLVVHAGDWVSPGFLEELGRRSKRLVACYGNNDGPELRRQLPLVARTTVEEVRLAVIHETGAAAGREARMDARFPEVDLLVFGHSHTPWDSTTPKGLRLLNPGSPTDRRRQPHRTYLTVDIDGRNVRPMLHELPS